MKRTLVVLVTVMSAMSLTLPAAADPGHDRPKITRFEFAQPALKSGINETLIVTAHDPNSWIQEIQVQWEDANGDGGVVFAHTFCVQDPDYSDPGTVAKLKIPIFFDQPGSYHVEARALSSIRCEVGNNDQTSRALEMDVVVKDPSKSFTDPNDSAGPFDIVGLEQTQSSSETSATTEIVHRITMAEPWTNDDLAGPSYMELYFDLDGDSEAMERILTIDLNEDDGTMWASMLDPWTGQSRGYARVRRTDDSTLEVAFPPLLLRKGIRSYRWYAVADGSSAEVCAVQTCADTAPDSGLFRHRL